VIENFEFEITKREYANLTEKHKKTGQYQLAIPIVGGYVVPVDLPHFVTPVYDAMLCLQCRSNTVTNSLHLRPLDDFIQSIHTKH